MDAMVGREKRVARAARAGTVKHRENFILGVEWFESSNQPVIDSKETR